MHISHFCGATDMEGLRVFVAEDSQLIRVRIVALITGCAGVECVGWSDSVSGCISGIRDTRPHGLILDLKLLDGSGLDVLRTVRVSDPAVRIAVFSNWTTDQHRDACRAQGAECVLDKSTQFLELRTVVLGWADARGSLHPQQLH